MKVTGKTEHRGILIGVIQVKDDSFTPKHEEKVATAQLCSEALFKKATGLKITGNMNGNVDFMGDIINGFDSIQLIVAGEFLQLHAEGRMVYALRFSEFKFIVALPNTDGQLVIMGKCELKKDQIVLIVDMFSDQSARNVIGAIILSKQLATSSQNIPPSATSLSTTNSGPILKTPVTSVTSLPLSVTAPLSPLKNQPVKQTAPLPPVNHSSQVHSYTAPLISTQISEEQKGSSPQPAQVSTPNSYQRSFSVPSSAQPQPEQALSSVNQMASRSGTPIHASYQQTGSVSVPLSCQGNKPEESLTPCSDTSAVSSCSSTSTLNSIVREELQSHSVAIRSSKTQPIPSADLTANSAPCHQETLSNHPTDISHTISGDLPDLHEESISHSDALLVTQPALPPVSVSNNEEMLSSPSDSVTDEKVPQESEVMHNPADIGGMNIQNNLEESLCNQDSSLANLSLHHAKTQASTEIVPSITENVLPSSSNVLNDSEQITDHQPTYENFDDSTVVFQEGQADSFSSHRQSPPTSDPGIPQHQSSITTSDAGEILPSSLDTSAHAVCTSQQIDDPQPTYQNLSENNSVSQEEHIDSFDSHQQSPHWDPRDQSMVEYPDSPESCTSDFQTSDPEIPHHQVSTVNSGNGEDLRSYENFTIAPPVLDLSTHPALQNKERTLTDISSMPSSSSLTSQGNEYLNTKISQENIKLGHKQKKNTLKKIKSYMPEDIWKPSKKKDNAKFTNTSEFNTSPGIGQYIPSQTDASPHDSGELPLDFEEDDYGITTTSTRVTLPSALQNDINIFLTNEYEYIKRLDRIYTARKLLSPKLQTLLYSTKALHDIHNDMYGDLYANMSTCSDLARVFISYTNKLESYKYHMMNSPEVRLNLKNLSDVVKQRFPQLEEDITMSWKRLHYYYMNLEKMLLAVSDEEKTVITQAVNMLKNLNFQADSGILLDSVKNVPYNLHLRAPLLLHHACKISGISTLKGKSCYLLLFADVIVVTTVKEYEYTYQRDINIEQAEFVVNHQENKLSVEVDFGGNKGKHTFTFKFREVATKETWQKEIHRLKQELTAKAERERYKRYGLQQYS